MGERRTFHTPRVLDLGTDQRHSQIYPDNSLIGSNNLGYRKQAVNLMLPDPRNNLYADPHGAGDYPKFAAQSSMNEPYILPPSSNGNVSLPWYSMTANCMLSPDNGAFLVDNSAGNIHLIENPWLPFRRENVRQDSVSYPYFSGAMISELSFPYPSQSFGSLEETGANVPKHSTLVQPEHQGNGTSQVPGGSLRSVRSRLNSTNTPLQPAYIYYSKDFLSENLAAQSFQPTSNPWMAQNGNIIAAGVHPSWSYTNPIPISHGECISPGPFDMASTTLAYKHYTPISCPSPLQFSHEDLHMPQSMQAHSSIGHPHFSIPAAFYPHPLLQPNNLYPSTGFQSGPGLLSFIPSGEQIYRPPVQLTQQMGEGSGGWGLSSENAAALELSNVYEAANTIDEHSDMRLDVDGMTYEELLALEEQIGVVKTGLTEESILKNLKESVYARKLPYSISDNETCVICQVEYEEGESLGTLNCGHKYHSPCIKEWLQIKNLCPICKITAFSNS